LGAGNAVAPVVDAGAVSGAAAAAAADRAPGPQSPGATSAPALIHLQSITREFALGHSTVRALRGVDLRIGQRELVAIWGPSGSGKSTLMNIVGLIDRPSTGRLLLDGRDTAAMADDEMSDYRNRHIGFVFQSFNLVPVLDALENVMLPLQIHGIPSAVARKRAAALLEQVGLAAFGRFLPDRLSGGQRQRVGIARALVAAPELIVADEPTANLDTENADHVVELMRSLNHATGVTFVFTTHDPRLLAHVHRRILLKDGRIESDLSSDE
jgi:putative ABC transport system ATP-binding protein